MVVERGFLVFGGKIGPQKGATFGPQGSASHAKNKKKLNAPNAEQKLLAAFGIEPGSAILGQMGAAKSQSLLSLISFAIEPKRREVGHWNSQKLHCSLSPPP